MKEKFIHILCVRAIEALDPLALRTAHYTEMYSRIQSGLDLSSLIDVILNYTFTFMWFRQVHQLTISFGALK